MGDRVDPRRRLGQRRPEGRRRRARFGEVRTAMRPVRVRHRARRRSDAGRHRVVGGSWSRRPARRSTPPAPTASALHAVGITGQWGLDRCPSASTASRSATCCCGPTRARVRVREVIGGPVSVSASRRHKALPFVRITGGARARAAPTPPATRCCCASGCAEVYARTATLLEPVDYLGLRFTGRAAMTPASMILSWLTDNRPGARARLRRRPRRARAATAHGCPSCCPRGRSRPAAAGGGRGSASARAGARWSAASPTCTRRSSVRRGGAVRDAHRGVDHAVDRRACRSSAPTCCTRSRPSRSRPAFPVVANNQETGGAALQWLREQIVVRATACSAGQRHRCVGCGGESPRPDVRGDRWRSPPLRRGQRGAAVHAVAQRRAQPRRGQGRARRVAQHVAAHQPRDARALRARGRRAQRSLAVPRRRTRSSSQPVRAYASSAAARRATSGA